MARYHDDLPDWTFTNDEISFGQYRLIGRRSTGESIDVTGADPGELTKRALDYAKSIEAKRAETPRRKV